MAVAFSMTALSAALPSIGMSVQARVQSKPTSSIQNAALRLKCERGAIVQAYAGLRVDNPLQLRIDSAADGITSLASNGSRWFAMRHSKRGARLGRPADQRKALLRGLTTELLRHGRIKTTHARARAMRKYVDKMITLAKGGSLHERRQALGFVYDKVIVQRMFEGVPTAPEYMSRNGGYTRIVRTMPRRGDNAPMAYIELLDTPVESYVAEEEEEEEEVAVV